ncbi:hypothetical protein ONZ43_g3905 [Nemania bipapillata]|uniref:Uncharacterized protein n=1 Tax=Nemania bipapillata TaxID=110536 RepID=A0ACC2IUY0_9PEZI|nr:hypothetical protein ONZ43_g3905 [Nemania bipapillata]
MPKIDSKEDEELGVLEDKTEALTLHSKRLERIRKKQTRKAMKVKESPHSFLSLLPYELVMEILILLKPSDLFRLQRTSKPFHDFIIHEEARLALAVLEWRYSCLQRCFRLPVLLANIDPAVHRLLQTPERQEILTIHKKPYQHIKPPEPTEVCTCLTCTLRWSALAVIVDFAHWQEHLDKGEPIPMIPRGKFPEWNQAIITAHADIYLLETFMPNRSWSQDFSRWLYVPAEQHDRDIEFVVLWAERRRRAEQQAKGKTREQASTLQIQP